MRTKVVEYQKQLDSVEESIRKETKQNERIIADRAIKQIELINQKYVTHPYSMVYLSLILLLMLKKLWNRNEQEFALVEEKHREEMELGKIRLENAAKTIVQLEEELSVYRAKR